MEREASLLKTGAFTVCYNPRDEASLSRRSGGGAGGGGFPGIVKTNKPCPRSHPARRCPFLV